MNLRHGAARLMHRRQQKARLSGELTLPLCSLGLRMPVALVVLLLDITLIYHASRTGRLQLST
jgi:hypothetical protein